LLVFLGVALRGVGFRWLEISSVVSRTTNRFWRSWRNIGITRVWSIRRRSSLSVLWIIWRSCCPLHRIFWVRSVVWVDSLLNYHWWGCTVGLSISAVCLSVFYKNCPFLEENIIIIINSIAIIISFLRWIWSLLVKAWTSEISGCTTAKVSSEW